MKPNFTINPRLFKKKEKLLDEINRFVKLLKDKYNDKVVFEKIKSADELNTGNFIQVWGANKNNRNFHIKKPSNNVPKGDGQAKYIKENLINNGVSKEHFYGIDTMSDYEINST